MYQKLAALTAMGLVGMAGTAFGAPPGAAPQAKLAMAAPEHPAPVAAPAPQQHAAPSNTNADGTPKIVVHQHTDAENTSDARSDHGSYRISVPNEHKVTVVGADGKTTEHTIFVPTITLSCGAIAIPDNTMGPGEPMWLMHERAEADLKMAQANADLARHDADRARPYYNDYTYQRDILAENASFGKFDIGGLWGGGFGGGGGWGGPIVNPLHAGLIGPVTTTVTTSDQLGATAQRAFSQAAYPRNDGSQAAHDKAVTQFGNDSIPRNGPAINGVDQAHTNANKEHPTR